MRRPRLATAALAVAVAAAVAAAIPLTAHPARAAGGLTRTTGFGTNPGALNMYSYLPANLPAHAPLVVALHGCTQSANDYYSHSGWPKYADLWGFALVFPEQPSMTSPIMNCFDWGTPSNDTRGNGEALSIYQMVQYAISHYGVDPNRVYVTGLSAGAGMTSDLLADYPDVFAAGSIDSGPPAQCSTSGIMGTSCTTANTNNKTPQQWGDLVRGSYPGYHGPWPRVAIWQGTADTMVAPVAMAESRDQWTNVWGIGQTPSSRQSLPGGTTLSIYNDAHGTPAVETYEISGMKHGLAVHPGSGVDQCGAAAQYYLDYICSSYHTAKFFGLDGGSPAPGPTPPTPSPTASPTSSPQPCFTADNYRQTAAGRAHQSLGYVYANGSDQPMGLWNTLVVHTLRQTGPDYYVIADGEC
ncbi:PHB depolymerase family esterase [Planosporangium thailandense]|uniref:PHB depolymerase family esterase n=1 Tax=Planosporangium thailandense TaxID=765197 RepID=A0ABX0Y0N4_9ACTN|nr:PHB depolymerase family esterase [Planosporangium thailandense]NJC71000.1 PHB depolymerase family esterase [Planosporangium thailandense]